jgi:hypothetical protein
MIKIDGRVPRYSKIIRKFVQWMNEFYPMRRTITIHAHGHRELTHKEINQSILYGTYTNQHIRVALGGLDETMSLIVIGHELGHAQQHQNNVPLAEPYADHFAIERVLQFREYERTC